MARFTAGLVILLLFTGCGSAIGKPDSKKQDRPVQKTFALSRDQIRPLAEGRGGAFATDRIMVEGLLVGYMYREKPDNRIDSGWRFLAGDEDDAYMSKASNMGIYDVNTIANYDPAIIPLLDSPIGSAFHRQGTSFVADPLGPPGD
jgi:hypothetical protein